MRKKCMSYSLIGLALASVGCGPLLPIATKPVSQFVIVDLAEQPSEQLRANASIDLIVREATANRLIHSNKIVFSESAESRGYYQYARWTEPPTRRFSSMLLARFDAVSFLRTASRIESASNGDYQLHSEILEFQHNMSDKPGNASVKVRVELIHLPTRDVVSVSRFSHSVALNTFDAEGAVEALTLASNHVIGEIVRWVESAINTHNPSGINPE